MAEFVFADHYALDPGKTRDYYTGFMKGLVHKANNLTGIIQGFGSLLLLEDNLPSELRENIEQMDSAARTMSELNKKVLTASGCANIDPGPVSLPGMFGFLEERAQSVCSQCDVLLRFEADSDLPPITADSAKLSDIFQELVNNAAHAASGSREKMVKIEMMSPGKFKDSENVAILIHNTVPEEIPSAKIAKFFEPFVSTKGNEYLGLGLTMAAILCGQMNIRLGLKGESDSVTTWLSLPLA